MSDDHALAHEADAESGDGKAMRLAAITPDPRNTRRHDDRNLALIEAALCDVGAARSVVVNGTGTVLAGNATVDAT